MKQTKQIDNSIIELRVEVKTFSEKALHKNYHVEIYQKRQFESKYVFYNINWSAIGSVDVETTKEFMKQLNEAIQLVVKINESNISIDSWNKAEAIIYNKGDEE